MNSYRADKKYKILKYKKHINVLIQMKNGNGMLVVYHNVNANFKRVLSLNRKTSIRNYREFLRLLNVNLIIKSKKQIKLNDINKIIFKVSQILSKEIVKRQMGSEKVNNLQQISNLNQNSAYNRNSHFSKLYILIFVCLCFILIFVLDYTTIKAKINKENELKLKEYENEYSINKCESKGHLQALKLICKNLEGKISIHRQDGVSTLSILIIWIVENFNHIINILGNNFIYLAILLLLILYKFF